MGPFEANLTSAAPHSACSNWFFLFLKKHLYFDLHFKTVIIESFRTYKNKFRQLFTVANVEQKELEELLQKLRLQKNIYEI